LCRGRGYADPLTRLYIKTVIGLVAIQAELFFTGQPDPIGSGAFAAAVADIGIKDPRFFRKLDLCLRYLEHILWRTALVIGEGFLAGHALRLRLQDQAKRLSALPVKKRKGLFAAHMEQQVSFADAAS